MVSVFVSVKRNSRRSETEMERQNVCVSTNSGGDDGEKEGDEEAAGRCPRSEDVMQSSLTKRQKGMRGSARSGWAGMDDEAASP